MGMAPFYRWENRPRELSPIVTPRVSQFLNQQFPRSAHKRVGDKIWHQMTYRYTNSGLGWLQRFWYTSRVKLTRAGIIRMNRKMGSIKTSWNQGNLLSEEISLYWFDFCTDIKELLLPTWQAWLFRAVILQYRPGQCLCQASPSSGGHRVPSSVHHVPSQDGSSLSLWTRGAGASTEYRCLRALEASPTFPSLRTEEKFFPQHARLSSCPAQLRALPKPQLALYRWSWSLVYKVSFFFKS